MQLARCHLKKCKELTTFGEHHENSRRGRHGNYKTRCLQSQRVKPNEHEANLSHTPGVADKRATNPRIGEEDLDETPIRKEVLTCAACTPQRIAGTS